MEAEAPDAPAWFASAQRTLAYWLCFNFSKIRIV